MALECIAMAIPEVKLVKPRVFPDDRGFFEQSYHEQQYREAGIDARFVQDNWSRSNKGIADSSLIPNIVTHPCMSRSTRSTSPEGPLSAGRSVVFTRTASSNAKGFSFSIGVVGVCVLFFIIT